MFNPPIVDIDLSQATHNDVDRIANLIAKHTLVIFKNQTLTLEQEISFNDKFKDVGSIVSHCTDSFRKLSVPNSNGKILRVGGLPNEYGDHGIAALVDQLLNVRRVRRIINSGRVGRLKPLSLECLEALVS